jgi:exopolyphosphatase/guanosine-5'-triphosphate,3'-diphosphate pyrophosphatase
MVEKSELYAAVDLGSNSFHLIIAEISNNQMHVIDSHKDMVRLANGLDKKGNLSDNKMKQAIDSLEKIGQRIQHIPKSHVRVVGTNTLRKAKNSHVFMAKASQALGKPIEIISGREEARILYLGVAHSLASDQGKRLVIDIGGGSTELIIGEEFNPLLRESLHMGCVSYTKKFFLNGEISLTYWQKAVLHARRQLVPIIAKYTNKGWQLTIGASGSMRATAKVMAENGYSLGAIEENGLNQLVAKCLSLETIDNLSELSGLSSRRAPVFMGGLAIIKALFESLSIDYIQICSGALREGLVYDLSGRLHHNDIRKRTIDKLSNQFEIDKKQCQRVQECMDDLIEVSNLHLIPAQVELLSWAAQLHELGLNISHSHFEEHAAYILINADMPGFSLQEQRELAVLVALQRRKIERDWLKKLSNQQNKFLRPLIIILRLAIVFNRPRIKFLKVIKNISFMKDTIQLEFNKEWLQDHPLTYADLLSEIKYLESMGVEMAIEGPKHRSN